MRISPRCSSKSHFETSLASSVLPTPVGPTKRNTPIGRFSSLSPARERRIVREIFSTASCCPTTRCERCWQRVCRRVISPPEMRSAGMPVIEVMTCWICSAVISTGLVSSDRCHSLRLSPSFERSAISRRRAEAAFS